MENTERLIEGLVSAVVSDMRGSLQIEKLRDNVPHERRASDLAPRICQQPLPNPQEGNTTTTIITTTTTLSHVLFSTRPAGA